MNNNLRKESLIQGLNEEAVTGKEGLPPVHLWQPDNCRDIDMRIDRNGGWHYMGSPIKRDRMVRLFSTILRRDDDDRYYLVTPVEKCGIEVDDVPFVAISLAVSGSGQEQELVFTTNVGDDVVAGPEHPLQFAHGSKAGVYIPYVLVRGRLEARISRAVYYELIDFGCVQQHKGADWFGAWSGRNFWPIALASEIETE